MGTTCIVAVAVEHHMGPVKFVQGTITLPTDYESPGGSGLDLSDYLSEIYDVKLGDRGGYNSKWDRANAKVKMFYYDYDAGADGPGIEVADTTDLNAEVLDFVAWGKP